MRGTFLDPRRRDLRHRRTGTPEPGDEMFIFLTRNGGIGFYFSA